MTLDEAIYREEALAYSYKRRIEEMETTDPTPLENMEKEHRQLAEWLRELKKLRAEQREVYENGYEEGYSDGFAKCLDLNV